ncbi:MAG: amidohydrolase family protein, partial [Microbacteriaceae bacterium]|nr:amidohydrolase family protein [Microbacteriaceae bacterium]
MTDAAPRAGDFTPGRPIVFRNATVITVDSAGVLENADVLIIDDTIAGVGHHFDVPAGALEIDAKGGIIMPGMIDTHRHMWQTALRGYGGDWALSQYFVFYYLTWGHVFRAEDIAAGNQLSALESVDQGVTTTVDWSHALRTPDYADAAVEALKSIPGRFVLAYGNYLGAPWEWMNEPGFQNWVKNFTADDMMGLQVAFDVNSGPDFHEKGAFQAARDLGLRVTTHAGVWGVNGDPNIEYMYENGFMDDTVTYVHASSLGPDSYHKIAA